MLCDNPQYSPSSAFATKKSAPSCADALRNWTLGRLARDHVRPTVLLERPFGPKALHVLIAGNKMGLGRCSATPRTP